MKNNPYQWFADRTPQRTLTDSGYQPLSIDSRVGEAVGSGATLAAALFGDLTGFDFSRLVEAIVPARTTLAPGPVVDVHVGGPHVLAHQLDTLLELAAPTQAFADESTPDTGAVAVTLAQPLVPAADELVSTVGDPRDETPGLLTNTLSTQLSADDPAPNPIFGRIPDLGFLQNLPAFAVVPQPGFDQPETVIRPSDSAVIPASTETVAVVDGVTLTRPDFIHELTPAVVADATLPLTLLFEHNDAGAVVASDLFITDPTPLPDFASIQFAAVLPDPIVDPGPLV